MNSGAATVNTSPEESQGLVVWADIHAGGQESPERTSQAYTIQWAVRNMVWEWERQGIDQHFDN